MLHFTQKALVYLLNEPVLMVSKVLKNDIKCTIYNIRFAKTWYFRFYGFVSVRVFLTRITAPDSKVQGATVCVVCVCVCVCGGGGVGVGGIWGPQDPGGPHVGPHELHNLGLHLLRWLTIYQFCHMFGAPKHQYEFMEWIVLCNGSSFRIALTGFIARHKQWLIHKCN